DLDVPLQPVPEGPGFGLRGGGAGTGRQIPDPSWRGVPEGIQGQPQQGAGVLRRVWQPVVQRQGRPAGDQAAAPGHPGDTGPGQAAVPRLRRGEGKLVRDQRWISAASRAGYLGSRPPCCRECVVSVKVENALQFSTLRRYPRVSGNRIAQARFVRVLDAWPAGVLHVRADAGALGFAAVAGLDVRVVGDEIRVRRLAGILTLARYGLLVMGSVERIDTHDSPPVAPKWLTAFEAIRGNWCAPQIAWPRSRAWRPGTARLRPVCATAYRRACKGHCQTA